MKKVTLLVLLLVFAVSFGQRSTVKTQGVDNPIHYNQQQKKQAVAPTSASVNPTDVSAMKLGDNSPIYHNQQQKKSSVVLTESQRSAKADMIAPGESKPIIKNQQQNKPKVVVPSDKQGAASNLKDLGAQQAPLLFMNLTDQEEIFTDQQYQANLPSNRVSPLVIANRNPLADIVPTAGATETFNPATGDNFFDPGGPGGANTDGAAGNYPNCNCDTQTTLAGVTEIEFLDFGVNGTFDYLRIYDGTDATGTVLYDNSSTGANTGDKTLAQMIASNGSASFTSTSGNFFFFFHASSVVNWLGWDVEIVAAGGGGGPFPDPYCGPLEFNSGVEPITLVEVAGISNVSDATLNGSPAHEDFTSISGDMEEGMSYPIALEGNTGGGFTNSFTVFIDWNQDGVLDNASERYQIGTIIGSTGTDGQQATGNIVVPSGVTAGPTRMRVIKRFQAIYATDSCIPGSGFGQAEDYTINVTAGGGGGTGGPCTATSPSNNFENGKSFTKPLGRVVAVDVIVADGEDFMLENLEFTAFIGAAGAGINAANVDVFIYEDDGTGTPGALITSQIGVVPDSQTEIGVAFGFAAWSVVMDITDVNLPGQTGSDTTYWVGLSLEATDASNVFWEDSTAGNVGFGLSYDDGVLGFVTDPTLECVYTFDGTCTPIGGGGGGPCASTSPSNNFENGKSFTKNLGRIVAADVIVADGEDFMLENLEFTAFIGAAGAGINAANVDVFIYEDDGTGTPGALITSQIGVVPDSQTEIGVAFGFAAWSVVMDITDVNLPGQTGSDTTYWVGLSLEATDASNVFWEDSTAGTVGFGLSYDDGVLGFVTDPTLECVYTFDGTCTPIGGGGGAPCAQDNPENAFENGYTTSTDQAQRIAFDITVPSDTDFTLNTATVDIWANPGETIVSSDITFYSDAAGAPGTVLTTQTAVVPTSQTVIGNNFGFDISEVVFDITPEMLAGQAGAETTYWVVFSVTITSGSGFISSTTASIEGFEAYFTADGVIWNVIPGNDIVYIFEGDCEAIGGGGTVCSEENPNDFTFENGYNCSSASAFMTANDVTVAADTDFTLTNITASIFANGGIANVDVNYYADAAGLPGAVIGSEASVTIDSQAVIGTNFGLDVNEVEMTVAPFLFAGQAGAETTYWIELSVTDGGGTGSVFWVVTSSSAVGNPTANFDGVWAIPDPLVDGVYIWEGNCEPIGGGGLANDDCSGAIAVSCGDSITGTTIDATVDSSAPACGPPITSPGVWYKLNDNSGMPGDITISLCAATDFDSKISVYSGNSCAALVCVDGNDDSCGLQSEITFASDGNTQYYILIHSFGGATGNFSLDVTCTPNPPPNDMIANSIDVDQIGFPYTDPQVNMPAATTENGNPAGCDLTGANGVWYNFVPFQDGTANATIVTPGGASSVTFYTAPNENATETDLTLVAQNSNQCAPGTSASIFTLAGQAYYVFVLNSGAVTDITIDGTGLGVSDNTLAGFSFYPNPTNGIVNLQSVENIDNVSLYNVLGQLVIEKRVNATTSELDISGLNTGTYLMKVSVNGEIGTYRVLKQ